MIPDAPSRVLSDNAAKNTREEEKTPTAAVAAGEDPAPVNFIDGAPDEKKIEEIILTAKPIRALPNVQLPLSFIINDGRRKGDPTPQGRAAPGTPTGSALLGSEIGSSEMRSDSVELQNSVSVSNTYIDPVMLNE